ncbi:hypothetical protein AB4144_64620, partial [Rhizobiaceae sp. 2RAB30]
MSTAKTELVRLTSGFQPEIVPSSVAKMKVDVPDLSEVAILKPCAPWLNTCPVGLAGVVCPGGVAIVMTVVP